MNLHTFVSSHINAVNPFVPVRILPSIGYTTGPDGKRAPAYDAPVEVSAQRQPLQYTDIEMVNGLNIQGTRCKIYLKGNGNGIVRANKQGGDLIVFPDGSTWLVAVVSENWAETDGWISAICTLQNVPFNPTVAA